MCSTCVAKYYRSGSLQTNIRDITCTSCNLSLLPYVLIIICLLLAVSVIGYFSYQKISAAESTKQKLLNVNTPPISLADQVKIDENKETSVVQRIFLSHIQVLGILSHFQFHYPPGVQSLFTISQFASTGGFGSQVSYSSILSSVSGGMECLFYSPSIPFPFNDLMVTSFLFLTAVCLIILFWSIVHLYKMAKKRNDDLKQLKKVTRQKIIICIIVLTFMFYNKIMTSFFQLFCCTSYDNSNVYRLVLDPDVICFSKEHYGWIVIVGLPCFIVLIVGLPFIGIYKLYSLHKRNKMIESYASSTYGFLYDG